MIKQAEVQSAYLQGRQAAMTKLAQFSDPGFGSTLNTAALQSMYSQLPSQPYFGPTGKLTFAAKDLYDKIPSDIRGDLSKGYNYLSSGLGVLGGQASDLYSSLANNPNARLAAMGLGGLALGGGLGYLASRGSDDDRR